MPLFLVIGAAYAVYTAQVTKKGKVDPTIDIRSKSTIQLSPVEQQLSILELPIGSISFFEGDYRAAAAHLQKRCEAIITANPWLAGRLMPIPDLMIVYDPYGNDRPPDILQVFEPGTIALKYSTPYNLQSELLGDAVVLGNDQLVGQNLPLWRVSVIPDAGESDTKFAVVVTMSHAIGDAHTYYKFYNMLHCDADVVTLNPKRIPDYEKAVHEYLGEDEATFLEKLVANTKSDKNETPIVKTKEMIKEPSFDSYESSANQPEKILEPIESARALSFEPPKRPKYESSPLYQSFKQHRSMQPSMEENVFKIFIVNQEWVSGRKGRRGSVFEPDYEETTDISTALSANSIITSWFFRMNEVGMGFLMVNLRKRLHQCQIEDSDCGNYVHALLCNENDYGSPSNLQHFVQTMHRENSSITNFDRDRNASISVNWANFYRQEIKLAEGCHQLIHVPIYNSNLLRILPDKMSLINLFTARCPGIEHKRQAGAIVLCKQSIWGKIQESGIVGDMIMS